MTPVTAPEITAEYPDLSDEEARLWQYKPYAGVGSRRTPAHILDVMRRLGYAQARLGWTLRSGGAEGADKAFEHGCASALIDMPIDPTTGLQRIPGKEIYVAGHARSLRENPLDRVSYQEYTELWTMARDAHPNWDACDDAAQLLHMRNVMQVLGSHPTQSPNPAVFVVYWFDGVGGTGQALRVAEKWNDGAYTPRPPEVKIDFRNLFLRPVLERVLKFLGMDAAAYKATWRLNDAFELPAPAAAKPAWPGSSPAARPAATLAPGPAFLQPAPAPPVLSVPATPVAAPVLSAPVAAAPVVETGQDDQADAQADTQVATVAGSPVVDTTPSGPVAPAFVWTVGHGPDAVPAFLRRLLTAGITTVVDARDLMHPGAVSWFGRDELKENLEINGFAYVYSPKLAASQAHVQERGVATLVGYVRAHPAERVAVLDGELDYRNQRHNRLLVPSIQDQGVYVRHLQRDGSDQAA